MTPDQRLAQMPKDFQNTYKKAIARKSMAAAVKAMCSECVGYVREEVRLCTDTGCPLFRYRPFTRSRNSSK